MSDRAIELEGRVVKYLEEIAEQQASFDRVSAKLTEDGFSAAWGRKGTPAQIDEKGSLERAYEQMVNDLQDMLGTIELAAFRRGSVPDPQLVAGGSPDKQAWWREAEHLGFDISKADRSHSPGRWRRLALYGHLEHDVATRLLAWSDVRQLLQHAYAERTLARGREVWATMHEFRVHVPQVVEAILALQSPSTEPGS
jgi:hypothetical protein